MSNPSPSCCVESCLILLFPNLVKQRHGRVKVKVQGHEVTEESNVSTLLFVHEPWEPTPESLQFEKEFL